MWKNWVTAILGLFTIAVPFVEMSTSALAWTLAILGIAVAALATWAGAEGQQYSEEHRFLHQ